MEHLRGYRRVWADRTIAELSEAYEGSGDELTKPERTVLRVLAARADHLGIAEVARSEIAKVAVMDSRELRASFEWLAWRRAIRTRRVSEPGQPRVERVALSGWEWPADLTEEESE